MRGAHTFPQSRPRWNCFPKSAEIKPSPAPARACFFIRRKTCQARLLYQSKWRGASGDIYVFTMLPYQTLFPKSAGPPEVPEAAGVYIFSRVEQGIRVPIYIGMSSNLNNRLNIEWHSHHKRKCIESFVLDAVHIHITPSEAGFVGSALAAGAIEKDLIQHHQPPCNEDVGQQQA